MTLLPRRSVADFLTRKSGAVPEEVRTTAEHIVRAVEAGGEQALLEYAVQLGDLRPGDPLYLDRTALQAHLAALDTESRTRLESVADGIESFARAQLNTLKPLVTTVPGGTAGHQIRPVACAGCYAPGGRYPLPSSALMTAITARVAGVGRVWVASPNPAPITIAAAALAGADGLLRAGGAHAIAALAFGVGPIPPSDVVVGPGNQYVTAAKQYVAGRVAIDMLAGPSELVVLADDGSDPALVAADLLAQAEHDVDALPIVVTTDESMLSRVEAELERQLSDLTTAATARRALANGGAVLCRSMDEALQATDTLAPEHLHVCVSEPDRLIDRLEHFGAAFIGQDSAEVFGDYGIGPNHVLPTGGTARSRGGLSVLTFLRVRTWLRLDESAALSGLIDDVTWLARQEGLEAHARAAERRRR